MGDREQDLMKAARAMMTRAYAPYSNFAVGAALYDEHGRLHAGCNVENAAYPNGTCAEAGAIAAMVAAGGRRIESLVVMGGREGDTLLCTPCGGCRQRIREFAAAETPVVIAGPEGARLRTTLGQLLPQSFGPDNLGTEPLKTSP